MTVMDPYLNAIWLRRLILKNVPKVGDTRQTFEASVSCHFGESEVGFVRKPHK